jgi:subtilisin-like proprotein convertase family protein
LVLPYDGTYTILVGPESAADLVASNGGPFGSDDWLYVGEIAGVSAPTGTAGSLTAQSTVSGEFPTLQDNLYTLDGFTDGDFVRLTAPQVGEDTDGIIRFWRPGTDTMRTSRVSSDDPMYLPISDSQSPYILADWTALDGPADGYSLRAERVTDGENLGNLTGGGDTVTGSTQTINAGDNFVYAVSVPDEHVLEVTHTNQENEDATVVIRDGLGQPLARQPDLSASTNINSSGEDDDGYIWVEHGGVYVIDVQTDETLTNHSITLSNHDPVDLGTGNVGDTLNASLSSTASQYRSNWFTLETLQPATADVTVNGSVASGDSVDFDSALFALTDGTANLAAGEGEFRFALGTDSISLEPAGLKPGNYLVRVGLEDTIDTIDVTTELTSPPSLEKEPNNSVATATSLAAGQTLLGDIRGNHQPNRDPTRQTRRADEDLFAINLNTPLATDMTGEVRIRAAKSTEDAWSCSVVSPNGTTVDAVSNRDRGCLLHIPGDTAGAYGVKVAMEADATRRYRITYTKQSALFANEPNDESSTAVSLGLTNQDRQTVSVGRISSADPVDQFQATIPSTGGSPELVARLEMIGPDPASNVTLAVKDGSGSQVAAVGPSETFVTSTSGGSDFSFVVSNGRGSTLQNTDGAYRLTTLAYEPDITATSSPGVSIPDSQPSSALDTINVSQTCASVGRTTLDVTVTGHPARTYLEVTLTSPDGTTRNLLTPVDDPTNHVFEPLDGNIPLDYPPENGLDAFNGGSGQGDWKLTIVDSSFAFGGTLDSWSVNLNCQ